MKKIDVLKVLINSVDTAERQLRDFLKDIGLDAVSGPRHEDLPLGSLIRYSKDLVRTHTILDSESPMAPESDDSRGHDTE